MQRRNFLKSLFGFGALAAATMVGAKPSKDDTFTIDDIALQCTGNKELFYIIAARAAIGLDDSFADAHRILGVCLRAQGKNNEAKQALQRAADLGDTVAKELLEK